MKLKFLLLQILLLSCFENIRASYWVIGFANNASGITFKNAPLPLTLVCSVYQNLPRYYNSGTFQIVSGPSHGTITGLPYTDRSVVVDAQQNIPCQITYTPNAGYEGTDSFTYQVGILYADNTNTYTTNTATVSINVVDERVYVTSTTGGHSTVSSVDVASGNLNSNVTSQPNYGASSYMAISPNGARAYVCYPNSNKVSVINPGTNAWIQDISDPNNYLIQPVSIAVSPDGTKAYVATSLGIPGSINASVSIIDTATCTATGQVSLQDYPYVFLNPTAIAFTPDGTRAYVCGGYFGAHVWMITVANNSAVSLNASNANEFSDVVISPDGNYAYLVDGYTYGHNIYIMGCNPNLGNYNTIIGTINHGGYPFDNATQMAIAPNGLQAYVTFSGSNTVAIIDLNPSSSTYWCVTGLVQDMSPATFNNPTSVAIDPYGLVAYVANNGNGKLSVINLATNTVTSAITGFTSPQTVCFLSYAPVANSQTVGVGSSSTNKGIFFTAADPRNQTLTYAIASNPLHGTLSGFNATAGSVLYTPTLAYAGPDSFTFTARDTSLLTSAPAKVTIDVYNLIANSLSLSVGTSSTNNAITLTGYDPLGKALTYTISGYPNTSHGTLSGFNNTTGAVMYTPTTGYTGLDSFSFYVTDSSGVRSGINGTVTINVSGSPHVAANTTSATVQQNVPTLITLTGVTTGSALTFATSAQPSHGTVTNYQQVTPTMATCTYTSTGSYTGQDSFTFTVTNTALQISSPATVNVNILPPSQRAYVADSNGGVSAVSSVDVASGAGTLDVSGLPNYGISNCIAVTPDGTKAYVCYSNNKVCVINSGSNAYLYDVIDSSGLLSDPHSMAISPDGSKAYICDLVGNSVSILNIATHTITGSVSGSITIPGAIAFTPDGTRAYVMSQGTTGQGVNPYVKMITVVNDSFGATVSGLSLNGYGLSDFIISPDGNFGYVVCSSGSGGSSRGPVYIVDTNPASPTYNSNIGSIDDSLYNFSRPTYMAIAPNGLKAYVASSSNNSVSIVDVNPTSVTYRKVIGTVTGGTFNQPSAIAFTADGTKAYVTNYGNNIISVITTATDTITSTITGCVAPTGMSFLSYTPVASSQSINTNVNTPYLITLNAADPRNQTLTYALVSNPSHGTLSAFNASTGRVSYTPTTGYTGSDSFTFTATNTSNQTSMLATVSITVNDSAPTANPQTLIVAGGRSTQIVLTGTDLGGSALTFTVPPTTAHGTLAHVNNPTPTSSVYTYTPTNPYTGPDSFTFTVTNASLQTSSPATVSITVDTVIANPIPSPSTHPNPFQCGSNTTGNTFSLSGTGGISPYRYAIATPPSYASSYSLNSSTGVLTYTPQAGFVGGPDSLTFTVTDAQNITSSPAPVSIVVGPYAHPDSVIVGTNSTGNQIYLTASSVLYQVPSFSIVSGASHGSTSIDAITGVATYTPVHGYAGQDSFTYKVTGSGINSGAATVTINVIDYPVANQPSQINATVGTPVNITLTGYDPAGEYLLFLQPDNVPGTTLNGGSLSVVSSTSSSAIFTYLINGYSGPDSFQFTVTNTDGQTSQPVTVNIVVADSTPTATGATLNSLSGLAQQITLFATDPGNQPLTYTIAQGPTQGTVSGFPQTSSTGSIVITYAVNSGVTSGTDSFLFTVTNPSGLSYTAIVNVTITSLPSGGSSNSVQVTNVMVSKYAGT